YTTLFRSILLPGVGGATKIGMPAAASWRATSSARRVSGSNDTTFLLGDGSIGDEKSPDRCLYEDQIEKLISECAQVTVRAITSLGPVYARETRLLVLVAAENPVHPATGTPGLYAVPVFSVRASWSLTYPALGSTGL